MYKRTQLVSASNFVFTNPKQPEEMLLTQDTHNALSVLEKKIKEAGGTLKINSLSRTWAKQEQLRKKYEDYQKLSDEEKKKVTFVPLAAPPGKSFHEACRAVDISLSNLKFPNTPPDKQLDKLWEISHPLGWTDIIDKPDETMSEAWHFDFKNEWDPVSKKMGYGIAAQCAILDVGKWDPAEHPLKVRNMFIQAQLLRLGHYEIGSVDGLLGQKSLKALRDLGLDVSSLEKVVQQLIGM